MSNQTVRVFQAYDNVESSVRKASVFCMVAMHQLAGDQLQPHLSSLNGSKLKLLNLVSPAGNPSLFLC